MERHPNDQTTDEELEEAFEQAKAFDSFPRIREATYYADAKVPYLHLHLSDGQDLLVPRKMLGELDRATDQQAAELLIDPHGLSVWWPQIDDGLYLPDFLEHRWGKVWNGVAA